MTVSLELDYALKQPRGKFGAFDLLFVRRPQREALERTLRRFARELRAERDGGLEPAGLPLRRSRRSEHVRLQGRRRRRRNHGRRDRPDDRRRGHPRRAQGRRAAVRRRRARRRRARSPEGQATKLVSKGKLDQEAGRRAGRRVLGNITGTTEYEGFGDVDFVIEAVPERMEIKHAVFADLDAVTPGHAILASNTSGLSITEIGDATQRPDKVVGFHFFWPGLVHAPDRGHRGRRDVAGDRCRRRATSPRRSARCRSARPRCPGFVVNRILVSTASEIWRYQDEQGCRRGDRRGRHRGERPLPMGPFRVADMLGLDTVAAGRRDMRRRLRRPLLRPRGHGGAASSAASSARRRREGLL